MGKILRYIVHSLSQMDSNCNVTISWHLNNLFQLVEVTQGFNLSGKQSLYVKQVRIGTFWKLSSMFNKCGGAHMRGLFGE